MTYPIKSSKASYQSQMVECVITMMLDYIREECAREDIVGRNSNEMEEQIQFVKDKVKGYVFNGLCYRLENKDCDAD